MPPIASATVSSQEPKAENIAIDVASRQLLQQAIDLLETLQDDHYTHCSIVMPGGTIGKHVR
jgi:hypothetical protein